MDWSEDGADTMCRLRCYVKDYGEEKILELVKYHRSHKQEATGTEGISVSLNRGYMTSLLHHQRDNDLSLIHISEPTRLGMISYAVFCLKKKKKQLKKKKLV